MKPMASIRKNVLNMTQVELAKAAGVNQSTVSRWDAGTLAPSARAMTRIRKYAQRHGIVWQDSWFFDGVRKIASAA